MSTVGSTPAALGGRRLVMVAALAPVAWLVHLSAMPALVPLACSTGATWPMWVTTVVCASLAAAGVVLLHRARRDAHALEGLVGADDAVVQRGRLWSGAGLVTGWLFLVLIVAEFLPTLVVDPCPP